MKTAPNAQQQSEKIIVNFYVDFRFCPQSKYIRNNFCFGRIKVNLIILCVFQYFSVYAQHGASLLI